MKHLALLAIAAFAAAAASGCVTRINIVPVKVDAPNIWDAPAAR